MASSLLSVIYTRRFTVREWPQPHAPRHSMRLIRVADTCLRDYIEGLSVRDDAPRLRWQYQLWPRELTVGLASDSVAQLMALPGFDAGDLRAALTAKIDEWLMREASDVVTVNPVAAGALS